MAASVRVIRDVARDCVSDQDQHHKNPGFCPGLRPGPGSDKDPHSLIVAFAELTGCAPLLAAEDAVEV